MVEEALRDPDSGVFGSNSQDGRHLYYKAINKKLYMVVVADLHVNLIVTGYISDTIKKGAKIR